jgi:hypothetical protein
MVKVVDAKVIILDKHEYAVVRSFFESSLKECYEWNIGVKLPNTDIVLFRKPGKWVLSIDNNAAVLSSDKVHGPGFPIGIWHIVNYTYYPIVKVTINTKGHELVEIDDIYVTYIDGPQGYPIPVVDLLEKMRKYIDAVTKFIATEAKC